MNSAALAVMGRLTAVLAADCSDVPLLMGEPSLRGLLREREGGGAEPAESRG